MMEFILCAIGLIVVVLGFFQLFGWFIYDCQLRSTSICFVLFRCVVIWKLPYDEIEKVELSTFKEIFSIKYFQFSFISKTFGKFVILKRNNGIFRRIIITPNQPDKFMNDIKRKNQKNGTEI